MHNPGASTLNTNGAEGEGYALWFHQQSSSLMEVVEHLQVGNVYELLQF